MIKQAERRIQVLTFLRQKNTEKEIATKLNVHPITIYRDVKWLKTNIHYDFTLTTNKVLDRLIANIGTMSTYELLAFLKLLLPTRIEQTTRETSSEKIQLIAWDLGNKLSDTSQLPT